MFIEFADRIMRLEDIDYFKKEMCEEGNKTWWSIRMIKKDGGGLSVSYDIEKEFIDEWRRLINILTDVLSEISIAD